MPEELKIIIDAEVSKAVSGLQKLKEEQKLLNEEIADFAAALKKNDAAIASKIKELNTLSKSSATYRAESQRLNKELDALRAKSATLASGLRSSKTEFAGITSEVKNYVRQANQIRSINEQASLSFQRFTSVSSLAGQAMNNLRGQVVSFATSFVSGFIGGFVVSLVSELIPGLNNAAKGFKDAELNALQFRQALDDVTEGMENLRSSLDVASKLANLRFRAQFGEGFAADVNEASEAIKANRTFIDESQQEFGLLERNAQEAREAYRNFREESIKLSQLPGFNKAITASRQLALTFEDLDKIPKSAIEKLEGAQKSFIEAYQANNETLKKLQEQRNRAEESNVALGLQIQIRTNAERKKIFEESVRNFEKFRDDIIARGKELAKFFESILVVPEFSILDTKADAFAKAKKFIDELAAGLLTIKNFNLKITPNIIIDPAHIPSAEDLLKIATEKEGGRFILEPEFRPKEKSIRDAFESIKKDFQEPIQIDLSLNPSFIKSVDDFAKAFAELGDRGRVAFAQTDFSQGFKQAAKNLQSLQEEFAITQEFANALGNSFVSMFDAIIEGKDPIKAFFNFMIQELQRLIAKLIATKIAAAFLNLAFPGAGGALGGGLPFGFTPQAFQGLNQLGGSISARSFANQIGSLAATTRVSGSDLLLVISRTSASQGRTG